MPPSKLLLEQLNNGTLDPFLASLYDPEGAGAPLSRARARCVETVAGFISAFDPPGTAPAALFSAPGRTELGGNHTDHQRGNVLCAGVDLDILACAAPNSTRVIRIVSQGYPPLAVNLTDLSPRTEEKNTSQALVRGVAAQLVRAGIRVSGFDAFLTSDVPSGSGLSSSAAYEVLMGTVMSRLFSSGAPDPTELARIGQRAENEYFGKPCGLMDQMASSLGGAVAIDFGDPDSPAVRRLDFDFSRCGHILCIVDTGSCHADLTGDYAAITGEMCAVAKHFGKSVLREVDETAFRAAIPLLRETLGDRAVLRALHFFGENTRAVQEAHALETGDFSRFLALVNESGLSSSLLLQNIWSPASPHAQAISLALAVGRELLGGRGAIRVHGGGFAGTVQAFVPAELLESFRHGMDAILGDGCCRVLRIRPTGGVMFSLPVR